MGEGGCVRCGGWTQWSPEDCAYLCMNCGRLWSETLPDSDTHVKRRGVRGKPFQHSPTAMLVRSLIIQVMTNLGGPITTRELRHLLAGTRGAERNYLVTLLSRMPEVEPTGEGTGGSSRAWQLRQDGISKLDYL